MQKFRLLSKAKPWPVLDAPDNAYPNNLVTKVHSEDGDGNPKGTKFARISKWDKS